MLRGIDVSSWQGDYDERAVAESGVGFVIVKLTEGTDYLNPCFAEQFGGARALGLVVGAYHYARPQRNDPHDEATHFLSSLPDLQSGDLVALDLEENAPAVDLAAWALAWLGQVERALGFKPLLYSYPWYMRANGLNDSADLAAYPLWYAHYDPGYPDPPGLWRGVAIEQDSGDAAVPGIAGPVDTDVFLGDRRALLALGKPAAADPAGALDAERARIGLACAGLPQHGGLVDLRAGIGAGYPEDAQYLCCEKIALWTTDGAQVQAFHRGQFEALEAAGRVVRTG